MGLSQDMGVIVALGVWAILGGNVTASKQKLWVTLWIPLIMPSPLARDLLLSSIDSDHQVTDPL